MTDVLTVDARHQRLQQEWADPVGWRSLAAVNHTTIGKRFIVTALIFFLVGGLLAMLIRAQLASPNSAFLDHDLYNQIFTMHGTVMMFLFAIPMLEGYALYLLPKMLGSRDLAYPRLGAYAYWCYLFGGTILLLALAAGVAPDSGWFMYTPLSGAAHSPGINADVWLIGVTFAEISAICAGVELMATILTMRAPGMSLDKMPLFAWYVLVTAAMILIGFPPLILGSILLELERALGWPFFEVARGGDPLLWQHLFWMFGHPEVYIIFLPAAGMVSSMVPVFSRHPIVGYRWIVGSIVLLAVLSFGLWVHHMFTVGIPHLAQSFFSVASMLVAIPTAIQFFSWIATLWQGRPKFSLPMLYLAGFFFVFIAGGLTGVMLALVPFNWQAHDTHFVVAHLHYVLVGGLVFPLLAGVYYWMPHVTGKMPSPRLGRYAFWLVFLGFNAAFLPMHLTGLVGMPRRIYTYPEGMGWDSLNLLSSVASFVMAAGFVLLILDVVMHAFVGRRAPRNPWGSGTLEWAMRTPAPSYNFASLPAVDDRDPLWHDPDWADKAATGRGALGAHTAGVRENLIVEVLSGRPRCVARMPGPSMLPFLAAMATGLFFVCLLFKWYAVALVGVVLAIAIFVRWAIVGGLRASQSFVRDVLGVSLDTHHARRGAPGEWGVSLCLLADAALLAALFFGYVFLWLVAPAWPPPAWVEIAWLPTLAALSALGLALALGAMDGTRLSRGPQAPRHEAAHEKGQAQARGAQQATGQGTRHRTGRQFLLHWVCWAVALVSVMALVLHAPAPEVHAYGAVTRVLYAYVLLHILVAALILGVTHWRAGNGYFAASQYGLDARIYAVWARYTAATGMLVVLAVVAMGVAA